LSHSIPTFGAFADLGIDLVDTLALGSLDVASLRGGAAGARDRRAEDMEFPSFSGDGRFLAVHYVGDMERVLGSPQDDLENAFTARMLLLLESRCVFNETVYERLLAQVVGFYFRDFDDHAETFVPVFLTNDILRFWRTLTLNYEFDRFQASQQPEADRPRAKAAIALKNYKLKFSRLATCYSMAVNLVGTPAPVTPDMVLDLCSLTPHQRFERLRGRSNEIDSLLAILAERYEEFLQRVQRDKDELTEELQPAEARSGLLQDADAYGTAIFELARRIASEERLRHLVV
jgi:hypothetical protein